MPTNIITITLTNFITNTITNTNFISITNVEWITETNSITSLRDPALWSSIIGTIFTVFASIIIPVVLYLWTQKDLKNKEEREQRKDEVIQLNHFVDSQIISNLDKIEATIEKKEINKRYFIIFETTLTQFSSMLCLSSYFKHLVDINDMVIDTLTKIRETNVFIDRDDLLTYYSNLSTYIKTIPQLYQMNLTLLDTIKKITLDNLTKTPKLQQIINTPTNKDTQ